MKTRRPACPQCGTGEPAWFVYGMPSPEMFESAEGPDSLIVLGGCVIDERSPKWHCRSCGNEWGRIRHV